MYIQIRKLFTILSKTNFYIEIILIWNLYMQFTYNYKRNLFQIK
jgi:hypothetical protein